MNILAKATSRVITVLIIAAYPSISFSDTISFDSLLSGKVSFGFDADNDNSSDVIFSTTDTSGFNTVGPGTNQNFIREPGLEGTSTLSTDLRVDFLTGARNDLSFGFALNSSVEASNFRARMTVYDDSDRQIGSASTVGQYTSTPQGQSSFPEGEVTLSFSGIASYATFDFESEFGRYIVDDFRGDFSGLSTGGSSPSRPQLQASVINSGFNFLRTADDVTDRRNQINAILNECTQNNGSRNDGSPCDYDALRRGEVEANIDLVKDANETAFASRDLVTRTSLLPGDNILEWIADAPFLIGEALGFFKVVGSLQGGEDNSEIESATIEGEVGEFTINPDFSRYNLDLTVDFSSGSVFDELIGQKFLFDYSFGDDASEIGLGLVKSVGTNSFGGDRVTLNFTQVSTNDPFPSSVAAVPLPAGIWFLLSALGGVFAFKKARRPRTA